MNRIYALALLTGTLAGGAIFPISDASAASFPETRLEATANGIGIDLVQFRPPGDDQDESRRRRRRDGDDDDGSDRDRRRDDNTDDGDDDNDRERRRGRGRDDDDDDNGRDRDRRRDRDDDGDRGRRRDRDRDRDDDRWRGRRWGGSPPPWALRQCFPRRPVWTPWGWRCRGYRPDY